MLNEGMHGMTRVMSAAATVQRSSYRHIDGSRPATLIPLSVYIQREIEKDNCIVRASHKPL